MVELHGTDVVQVAQQREQAPAGCGREGVFGMDTGAGCWGMPLEHFVALMACDQTGLLQSGWLGIPNLPLVALLRHPTPGLPALLVVPDLDLVVVAARHKQRLAGVEVHAAHGACGSAGQKAVFQLRNFPAVLG